MMTNNIYIYIYVKVLQSVIGVPIKLNQLHNCFKEVNVSSLEAIPLK
mgnify:CR=1 FL=1